MISLTNFLFRTKIKPNFRTMMLSSGSRVEPRSIHGIFYISINEFVPLSYFLLKIPDAINPLMVLRTVVIRWL